MSSVDELVEACSTAPAAYATAEVAKRCIPIGIVEVAETLHGEDGE